MRRLSILLGIFVLMLTGAGPAQAHFNLTPTVRVYQIEHTPTGLRVYLRTPMAYLIAGNEGAYDASGLPRDLPFSTNGIDELGLYYLVDLDALKADPLGLGTLAAKYLQIKTDSATLSPKVKAVRAYTTDDVPDFATLDDAKAALAGAPAFTPALRGNYVADTMVDVLLDYEVGKPVTAYTIASTNDPHIPDQEETANGILDYGPGGVKVFQVQGLMNEPVSVTSSQANAAWTFVIEGMEHIWGGLDHVLFVTCVVLGATGLFSLISRITGFTLGHSVTLTLGFLGFVPKGAWFIPTVETSIALSIIYAAAIAIFTEEGHPAREKTMFFVTFFIGMIHGLGFSFVLHEILKLDAPNLWQSLLAFNVGIEIGQLVIVLLAWPALLLLKRLSLTSWHYARLGLAVACIIIAGYWTFERLPAVIHSV